MYYDLSSQITEEVYMTSGSGVCSSQEYCMLTLQILCYCTEDGNDLQPPSLFGRLPPTNCEPAESTCAAVAGCQSFWGDIKFLHCNYALDPQSKSRKIPHTADMSNICCYKLCILKVCSSVVERRNFGFIITYL